MPRTETAFPRLPRPMTAIVLAVACALPIPALTQDLAGPYLAARQADYSADFAEVVEYGTRVLARDPQNLALMESLLVAHVGLGQIDQAVPVARRLHELSPDDQVAGLVLEADAMQREDWQRVLDLQQEGVSVGPLMDDIVGAWANFGQGKMSQALDIFETLAKDDSTGQFAAYHQGLALALAGDFEGAAALFIPENGGHRLDRQGIVITVQILSQLERNDDALKILEAAYPQGGDAEIEKLRSTLESGETLPFDAIRSARDGLAEMFYSVAQSLARDLDPQVVLLYSRAAEFLRPDLYDATLLSGDMLERLGRHALAAQTYGQVPESSRLYPAAARARAEVLDGWGRTDEAIAALEALNKAYPDTRSTLVALGDLLRRADRFDDAIGTYGQAIALIDEPVQDDWFVYFVRGICFEREQRWPEAEADFRQALDLNPEQPSVLNYLGYSYVEMRQNLDEALDMIQRAVAARPDDGYITDSLGWVYYQLGRYPEAVDEMERAVELMPVDPILNDHLGDTYWAVGRKREAEFQWSRALSFITDDTDLTEVDPDRIRRKLAVGLDKVLEEEGAPPLKTPDEDG